MTDIETPYPAKYKLALEEIYTVHLNLYEPTLEQALDALETIGALVEKVLFSGE